MNASHEVHDNDCLKIARAADFFREVMKENLRAHLGGTEVRTFFTVERHEDDAMSRGLGEVPRCFQKNGNGGRIIVRSQKRLTQMVVMRSDQQPSRGGRCPRPVG